MLVMRGFGIYKKRIGVEAQKYQKFAYDRF